jgi:hypothetical protein
MSLTISLSFGFLKRRTFLNEYFLRKQLLNLGSILFDLVPPLYGLQERQRKQISVCALISVVCPIRKDKENKFLCVR